MAEEAQLLTEKGVGYILDDARAHDEALQRRDRTRHLDYKAHLRQRQEQITQAWTEQKEQDRRQALSRQQPKKPSRVQSDQQQSDSVSGNTLPISQGDADDGTGASESLFDTTAETAGASRQTNNRTSFELQRLTPTTSHLFLAPSAPPGTPSRRAVHISQLPTSYPLYRHLNSRGYFQTPGLRFGCQYCVYPGDPLRYHSHFLAVGVGWDEEIDLMDLVAGGRLGTGVKKAFLIGGEEPRPASAKRDGREQDTDGDGTGDGRRDGDDGDGRGRVRMLSIEWAAM